MIVLTGATGFLGNHLLLELLRRDEPIRLLVRSCRKFAQRFPLLANHRQLEFIELDLARDTIQPSMLEGADTIVHTAAMVSMSREQLEPMNTINVKATEGLLRAAPRDAYFLFIGSVAAYGPTGTEPLSERITLPADSRSPYETTKRAATVLVRNAQVNGRHCGMLHPGIIYGPNAHGSLTRFAKAVSRKLLPFDTGHDSLESFVYVDDVVSAALEMLKHRIEDEFITVGEVSSLGGFLRELAAQSGGMAPPIHLSAKTLESLMVIPAKICEWFGASFPLTPTLMRMAQHHWAYRSDKAQQQLGIHFHSNRDGIAEWLKSGTLQ